MVAPSAHELSFRAAETGAAMVLIQAGATVAMQLPWLTDSLAVL